MEAETSRMHLQELVDELVKQVRMNEGKIAIYEQRTSVTLLPAVSHVRQLKKPVQGMTLRNFGEFIFSVAIDFYGIMTSCT